MPRWAAIEIVQGYYVSELVWMLHSRRVLAQLAGWQTVEQVADCHRWDPNLLRTLLEFLHKTTDLLEKDRSAKYRINRCYQPYARLGFYLDFFRGAYGNAVNRVADSLRDPDKRCRLPAAQFLARAFDGIGDAAADKSMLEIIRVLEVKHVLDLGCGSAALLCALARRDPSLIGWGIERSVEMCRTARIRVKRAGIGRRVKIIHGDVRRLALLLTSKQRHEIEVVHAGSLLNEFFCAGTARVVSFIHQLARLFPRRVLLVADYYGRVNATQAKVTDFRLTLLHDLAQAVSGQGVPPKAGSEWEDIYRLARVRLIRSYEGIDHGLAWFHHIIQL